MSTTDSTAHPTPAPAAIVLAAGLGTRMRTGRAKVLHEVGGEPMIVRALRPLITAGASPIVVVVGHQADQVQAVVERAFPRDFDLRFARQTVQRGTGDAARCGMGALPAALAATVLIINGDMPRLTAATLAGFVQYHHASGAVLSLTTLEMADAGAYGRIVRGADGGVEAIVEARDATPVQREIKEINAGLYAGQAGELRAALAALRADNAQREFYLTDTVAITRARGLSVAGFKAPAAAEFAGINSLEELAQVNTEIRTTINRRLMAAGVMLVDPATAYIGEQVEIGADSVIGPNVQIMGRSRIGAGVRIDGTAWLDDVEVGDGCHLKLGVRAEHCRIGPHCEVGPFANLREGTELAGHNRIGNFVETKQAKIGAGTKASHLSYLGDVTIGAQTNIGCGVITVNYDGYDKHRTEIGDRCMVGCDSQLIAPVRVGDDAYVASGTTVVRDVSAGALVTSHHPQREREGWSEGWRRRHQAGAGNSDR